MSICKYELFNYFDLDSRSSTISKSLDFVIFIDTILEVIALSVEWERFHRILRLLVEVTQLFVFITI